MEGHDDLLEDIIYPSTTYEKYDDLRELPLFKNYEKLNHENLGAYANMCSDLTQDHDENHDLVALCRKLKRNLHDISNGKKYTDISYDKRCTYLKYWFFDNFSTFHDWKDVSKISDKWNALTEKHSHINCNFDANYNNSKYLIMDIIVDFYEYYHNKDIKEVSDQMSAYRAFVYYFQENNNTYKHIEKFCLTDTSSALCKKFQECNEHCRTFLDSLMPKVEAHIEAEKKSLQIFEELKKIPKFITEHLGSNGGSAVDAILAVLIGLSFMFLILYKVNKDSMWKYEYITILTHH
ncbi:variable surface protein Vir24-related [Plasmodium vivax]|uniref:Variable surface protein Vir24-related n=2 Tax=Plasmodium vivax TaxID=5855 RepID=A5KCL8_PLAVS|nr:variable surface protein Vir24-related [Plasmodium vivax]EDL42890.1 variable surface protein Vir24-related [Plasmodium vivax]KNA02124.1 variable surface protein Vir24g [Plasmodium vivax North Korean]|eukprot:XP_001612664.1 variable surface protein Vir24-related [Plasmodium vivax Sal-1]